MFGEDQWMTGVSSSTASTLSSWSRHQDKLFERALVMFPEGTADRWEKVATQVPGTSPFEVRRHYEDLVHDVFEIDSGRVKLPSYAEASDETEAGSSWRARQDPERKKGVPWTEEEHRLFLIGLQKYGKGDWRSISRNAVVTRTPTQVASHAQKYYLRLNSADKKKDKKRSSIHDITTVDALPHPTHPYGLGQFHVGPPQSTSPVGPYNCFPTESSHYGHHSFDGYYY